MQTDYSSGWLSCPLAAYQVYHGAAWLVTQNPPSTEREQEKNVSIAYITSLSLAPPPPNPVSNIQRSYSQSPVGSITTNPQNNALPNPPLPPRAPDFRIRAPAARRGCDYATRQANSRGCSRNVQPGEPRVVLL